MSESKFMLKLLMAPMAQNWITRFCHFVETGICLAVSIAKSFQAFRSEFEVQYHDIVKEGLEKLPPATDDWNEVAGEPPAKKKQDAKTTNLQL